MPVTEEHWRTPRKTIANRYQNDDISYATHGALVAMECVRRLEILPTTAQQMRLLDYGCGTGRISRVLAGYFGYVHGYDPVQECIEVGAKESKVPQVNIALTSNVDEVKMMAPYDAVVSVNVLEHLEEPDQRIMLDTIKSVAKKGAPVLMWYSLYNNRQSLVDAFGGGAWVDDDNAWMAANPEMGIQVRVFRNP